MIFHKEVEDFLRNLQEIGVVDITRQKKAIDSYSMEKFEEIAQYNSVVNALGRLKTEAEAKKLGIPLDKPSVENYLEYYNKLIEQKEALKAKLYNLNAEYNESLPWGKFENDSIENISKLGFTPYFYYVSSKKFNKDWENTYPIWILNEYEDKTYFVILAQGNEKPQIKLTECTFPSRSADKIELDINSMQAQAAENEKELLSLTNCIDTLEQIKDELFGNLDLYLAEGASTKKADETIVIFEAFAPTEIDSDVVNFLEENNIYYLKEDAKEEDNPPIKLKNNFFAKLYEPIGELYMLPKYGELDLTIFFAPFYMLFFGLCLGDMGYGLVLILAG
ncbi:MAG: hypothetical protein Q4B21_07515, partial [Bacteroidia bacterium]|nr:hypothetical protein [Bacteroidia bacterium]